MEDYKKDQNVNHEMCASDLLFNNLNEVQETDERKQSSVLRIVEYLFNGITKILVVLKHSVFNEEEAAMYLRLDNPKGKGRKTIRYYALRAKQLTYSKIGRDGLIFTKKDLDDFLDCMRMESYRSL